jgi:hypothetical protein
MSSLATAGCPSMPPWSSSRERGTGAVPERYASLGSAAAAAPRPPGAAEVTPGFLPAAWPTPMLEYVGTEVVLRVEPHQAQVLGRAQLLYHPRGAIMSLTLQSAPPAWMPNSSRTDWLHSAPAPATPSTDRASKSPTWRGSGSTPSLESPGLRRFTLGRLADTRSRLKLGTGFTPEPAACR